MSASQERFDLGKEIDGKLKERGFLPMICEKGYRNHPLTEEQKLFNRVKRNEGKVRADGVILGVGVMQSVGF